MNKLTYNLAAYFGAAVALVLISMLLAYPYMILWNQCLVPVVSGLKEVEWLQMWGIQILLSGLFKAGISSK